MKWRFGIREKFALVAFGLVLICAILLFNSLFDETKHQVVEHELVDLQDETDLRCWEFIHFVGQIRREAESSSRNPGRLRSLVAFMNGEGGLEKDQEWWKEIRAVREVNRDGSEADLVPPLEDLKIPPIPSHTRDVAFAETGESGVAVASPIVALKSRIGRPGEKRWLREPAVWGLCRMPDDPDRALALLIQMAPSTDPRHLSFMFDDGAVTDRDGRGFLQHPDPVDENGGITGAPTFNFLEFKLGEKVQNLNDKEKWADAGMDRLVQRGKIETNVDLTDGRYFYLEGTARDRLRQKIGERAESEFGELTSWGEKIGEAFKDLEVRFSGPNPASGTFHFRLLARSEDGIREARKRVEKIYREKFGLEGSGERAVKWYTQKGIEAKMADLQLSRFYLGLRPEERPGAEDPCYYFGYATLREELAFSIEREFAELRKRAIFLAVISGFVAFGIAFWSVRPLTDITKSAHEVIEEDEESGRLQHQLERVRGSLPVHKSDEVGDIARALEKLLRQVLNGHERLRQLNADLDNRIQEQTKDLRAANEELMGLAKAKDEFLASVSHELRQPLNSIFGYLQFLEMSELSDEQKQDTHRIRQSASYLLALINDILDYQKIIMGGMELDPCEFSGKDFLEELQEAMLPQAKERCNTFVLEGAENIGTLYNDPDRLRQILTNLISNACKFTEKGTVTLRARRENAGLLLEVIDTGRGLKPEEKKQLFVKFKKLAAREGNKTGTGLGLAITRGLCRLMGGTIECVSTFGEGSTFTVKIPARIEGSGSRISAEESGPAYPRQKTGPIRLSAAAGGDPLVLVIDDDAAVRDLMKRFLEEHGYRVECAEDGETGFQIALESEPAAITLDVVLPDEDGWEVLSRFKSDPRTLDIPVLMVTFREEQARGYSLGAADYLVKPIEWGVLTKKLRGLISAADENTMVLVVDDDPGTRTLFRRALERDGLNVVEAGNGNEAVAKMEEQLPSAVLLDLMMPEADGFDFIEMYRKRPEWSGIPILVVTAKETSPEDRERLNGSVRAILQKGGSQRQSLLDEILTFVHHNVRPEEPAQDPAN